MEIRRVQVTGGSSYFITLPKSWIESLNIKKNDSVGLIVQEDGTLVVTPYIREEEFVNIKEFNVNAIDDPMFLFRCLIGAYISGYTVIKISSSIGIKPPIRQIIRKFTRTVIGQEIVEETDSSIVIKDILNPSVLPFDNTIRRMYVIVHNMHRDAITAFKEKDKMLARDIVLRDDEVDRLHWLIGHQQSIVFKSIVVAQKMGVAGKRIANYYMISKILERIGDHAVIIAKNILELIDKEIDDNIVEAISSASSFALEIFDKSVESFFKKNMRLANDNIESVSKLVSQCEKISSIIMRRRGEEAIRLGYIVESIRRVGEYSGDLSEFVIDYLV